MSAARKGVIPVFAAMWLTSCGEPSAPQSPAAQTTESVAAPAPESGAPAITCVSEPDPPRAGDNTVAVQVRDAHGAPLSDLEVTAVYYMAAMPAMSMPEMRDTFVLAPVGEGRYTGNVRLSMGGTWAVTINAKRGEGSVARKQMTILAKE